MPPPKGKYARKRKAGFDEDTSTEGEKARLQKALRRELEEKESESSGDDSAPSPDQKKARKRRDSGDGGADGAESMSIEETNKLRISLGLAPLEVDEAPKVRDAEDGEVGDKLVNEDGFEFRHRAAVDLTKKKAEEAVREKLETQKAKREVYGRVLKGVKGLAEDSDEDDGGAASWVEKQRKAEEEKRRAVERAQAFDQLEEQLVEEEKKKVAKLKNRKRIAKSSDPSTGGLVIGHSKEVFLEGRDQILVLDDKNVLDEDDEVLINPNLVDNERAKRNIDNRKKGDRYKPYEEGVDEFGNPTQQNMLAKYDEELGIKPMRETFRLGEDGTVDVEREERELEMKRKLQMASKQLVSLDQEKYKVASEYFTQEEMLSFRKPKKSKEGKKLRKRGNVLKADDLKPQDDEEDKARKARSRKRLEEIAKDEDEGGWQNEGKKQDVKKEPMEEDENDEKEDGEIDDETSKGPWKKATGGVVDVNLLKKTIAMAQEEDEEDDDEYNPAADLAGVVIDDEAESELTMVLEKARKLKSLEINEKAKQQEDVAARVRDMLEKHSGPVKMEVEDGGEPVVPEEEDDPNAVIIDVTKEYCRNIGGIATYGLAGNRKDAVDVKELQLDVKEEVVAEDEEEFASVAKWKKIQAEKERKRQAKLAKKQKERKGGWQEAGTVDSDDERRLREAKDEAKESSSDEDEDDVYQNVLGEEKDVTKGVGAMLKLAVEKGYIENASAKNKTEGHLESLKSKRFSKVETSRYDIEDKYQRKLERLGTTGSGPTRAFPEKADYKPDIEISYVDNKGREMEPKDAFRSLSWKFHGKNPGKKQIEKRAHRMDQKEKLKQMNSSDTPLGTLDKQRKKQEQLQTPFLVLSGSGRDATSLKKE